ncbi:TetR/AcrR family transcriptional regulator [Leucobacter sp. NPDC015123]|uniref:TetR/AcrR family transcriptional regulator n=1 Tax=Leucobacter sp. NPDC015123 TaxID=3364129 RepID=UPI0036F491DA
MSDSQSAPDADHVSARRRETRSRLLDAAAEVFTEFGIQGASVERICARADFTRGAFYSNFSSKEELFLALLGREYEQRAEQIRIRAAELTECLQLSPEPPTREDAAGYVTTFLSPSGNETSWFTLETEFLLLALRHPEGEVQHVDFNLQFRSELSNVVESIVHAAGRRFIIPVDRALTILAGGYERAVRVSALSGFDAPEGVNELGDRFAELLFTITEPV